MVGGTVVYSILTFLTGFAPEIAAVIALRVLAGIAGSPTPSGCCARSRRG